MGYAGPSGTLRGEIRVAVDTATHYARQTMSHLNLLLDTDKLKSKRDSYKKDDRTCTSPISACISVRTRPPASSSVRPALG